MNFIPLDHAYWNHEAESIRLMHLLRAQGFEFWE